ncbi:MAG TPA: NAD(P)/FAD-dependent oxidoreductase [Acidimicrobiales bacterium]|nr:NAD(P)/FAD-dependent oxidoreductase [Acidimicrobiales bacterium]
MTTRTTDVLIVGGGFAGVFAARAAEHRLKGRAVRIVLVAPENFLLFSPLLPEAASGTIEPRHAVVPLRELLGGTELLAGEVASLDVAGHRAEIRDIDGNVLTVHYRTLVLAPGSEPVTSPIPGLERYAVGFKTLSDAIWLRNRVLHQLETASVATGQERRRRLLTFTFVGGGYAGVEALAELESLVADVLPRYGGLRRDDFRWVLVEAQDSLLPGLDPRLAEYTAKVLRARGVEVLVGTRMTSCEDNLVVLSAPEVAPYRSETIVWTAGQRPSSLPAAAGLPLDDRGRVVVDDHLRVEGYRDVYALGDCAAVPDPSGGLCPPTAQHALRQGYACGQNVAADHGAGSPGPFTYRTRGLAVTLGRGQGTAQVKRVLFTGWPAWWMGRAYHVYMMPGAARRARVVSDWALGLLFSRDVAQLGTLGRPAPLPPPPGR